MQYSIFSLEAVDRGDDGSSPAAEDLHEPALPAGRQNLGQGHATLANLAVIVVNWGTILRESLYYCIFGFKGS